MVTYSAGLAGTAATASTLATVLALAACHNVRYRKGDLVGLKLVKLDCVLFVCLSDARDNRVLSCSRNMLLRWAQR